MLERLFGSNWRDRLADGRATTAGCISYLAETIAGRYADTEFSDTDLPGVYRVEAGACWPERQSCPRCGQSFHVGDLVTDVVGISHLEDDEEDEDEGIEFFITVCLACSALWSKPADTFGI